MSVFPDSPTSASHIMRTIQSITAKTRKNVGQYMRGKPDTFPDPFAIDVWAHVSALNPNNGGLHTHNYIARTHKRNTSPWDPYRNIENELISFMCELYSAQPQQMDGYVTSGSTEGNIMGLWLARNKFTACKKSSCVLITSQNCHFSILKAANLLGFDQKSPNFKIETIGLDESYGLCPLSLDKTIKDLIDQGERNFIVVLTFGTTITGSIDNIHDIKEVIASHKRKASFHIHVDAAFAGMVLPFLDDEYFHELFDWSFINSFTVDFHKVGYLPYNAGIFLCKKNLINHIRNTAEYTTTGLDLTLLTSRSAAMAVAAWAVIKKEGRKGFEKKIKYCLSLKNNFIKKTETTGLFKIIPTPLIMAPVIILKHRTKIKSYLRQRGIFPQRISSNSQSSEVDVFPFYFMPDMRIEQINQFFNDIIKITKGEKNG